MCWVKSFYFSFLVDWEHVTTPRAFTQTHKWMAVRLKAMLFLFLKSWHFGDTCKVFTPDPCTTRKKNELNVTLSKNHPDHDSHCSSVLYSIAHLAGWGVGGLPLLFSHSNTSPLWPYTAHEKICMSTVQLKCSASKETHIYCSYLLRAVWSEAWLFVRGATSDVKYPVVMPPLYILYTSADTVSREWSYSCKHCRQLMLCTNLKDSWHVTSVWCVTNHSGNQKTIPEGNVSS